MNEFEKQHLIGELATHRGYNLLVDQLETEFAGIESKLADSVDEHVDMSLLAQWKIWKRLLKRLRTIPQQSAERTSGKSQVTK